MEVMNEEEISSRTCGVESDSDIIRECERVLCSMETEESTCRRPVEKRKERSDDEDDHGFVTVTKRKPKRVLRAGLSSGPEVPVNIGNYSNSEEKHEVCVTSLCALPSQMAMARLLKNENIEGVIKIKYKSPFKVLMHFATNEAAEKLLNCKKFEELDYRCQKTYVKNVSHGMIRGVDLDMEEKDIISVLECEIKILSVKRLKRLTNEGTWIDCESIRVCFDSLTLPKYVIAYGCRMSVEPYVFPVTRCTGCWKYGHILKFCPTKKPLCPKCGNANHSNCEITDFKCLNCKGPHFVLDTVCPLFVKEKEIRKIMCKENVTYKKALQIMNDMHQHETQADEEPIREETKESEHRTQSNTTFDNSTTRSYRNVLISADVHKDADMSTSEEEASEERSILQKTTNATSKKKKTPKTKRNQKERDEDIKKDDPTDEIEILSQKEKSERKFDFKELLQKIRLIIFAKESFESKVMSIIAIIFEECKVFLRDFVSRANLFEGFFGLFFNNNG